MIELLKCGCGGKTIVLPCFEPNLQRKYIVICLNCGIRTEYKNTEAEAVEIWNRAMGGNRMELQTVEQTAKVVNYEDPFGLGGYGDCSECWAEVNEQYTYCPNCGAKLDWSERDE